MQKKRVDSAGIVSKLHRGVVYTSVVVTLYCTYVLGARAWHFYTVVKPEREKAALKMIEEGAHDKAKELKC